MIFIHNKLSDQQFMATAAPFLQQIYILNADVQGLLRGWCQTAQHETKAGHQFINYSAITFLQALNGKLLQHFDDAQLAVEMSVNLELFHELATEIRYEALNDCPQLTVDNKPVVSSSSHHLDEVFELFKSEDEGLSVSNLD